MSVGTSAQLAEVLHLAQLAAHLDSQRATRVSCQDSLLQQFHENFAEDVSEAFHGFSENISSIIWKVSCGFK